MHRLTLLLLVLLVAGCDSGDPSDGNVTGTITNTFSRPVQGATVVMSAGSSTACTTTTISDGTFACDVAAGTYTVTVTAGGYAPQTTNAVIGTSSVVTVAPLVGLGSIEASLVNGLTGAPIPNASVECRRQIDNATVSGVEFTGSSSATGMLSLAGVFTGNALCTANAANLTLPLSITIGTTTTGTVVATPAPTAGSYRVVLTWGETPRDLDSHLTGPTSGSDRFHVYFGGRGTQGSHYLDVDDVSSFGPETITIVPAGVNGMYRYSVHNYSVQGAGGGQSIHTSGATVRVYDATGLIRTYTPPAPTAANGGTNANTWRVFEMTVNGSAVSIDGTEPGGLGYFLASGAGDTTVFLTGGPVPTFEKALAL